MKPFFSHRTTRLTAAAMLIVWLLALGTGVANACLAQEDDAKHGHLNHHDADFTTMPAAMPDAMADDPAATGAHLEAADHDTASAKQACQNFCAAEQTGAIKQQDKAPAHPDAVLMSASMWWVAPLSAGRISQMPVIAAPVWTGPPLFIRFLRLTI
jgi:hypothetical protein